MSPSRRSPVLVCAALTFVACAHGGSPAAPAEPTGSDRAPVAAIAPTPAPSTPGFTVVQRLPAPPPAGRCGVLDRDLPSGPRPLLRGRLAIDAPSTVRERIDRGANAPPGTLVRESIVYVQHETEQLTTIAQETSALAPDDLLAYAAAHPPRGTDRGELAEVQLRGGGRAVFFESTSNESRTGNVPIGRAYVAMPEGTLVLVDVIVTSVAAPRNALDCRALARRTLEGLALGSERLDRRGGERSVGPLLLATIPEGYLVEDTTTQESAGILVLLPAAPDEFPAQLTVTVTRHPPNVGTPVERTSRYLGRNVSWRNLYGDRVERRSAVLRIPGREEYVHSLAEARTEDELAALIAIASRMRLAR